MLTYWVGDSEVAKSLDRISQVMSSCTIQDPTGGWTDKVASNTIGLAAISIARLFVFLWDVIRALCLALLILFFFLAMKFSWIFISMMNISELKSVWVNYFCSVLGLILLPLAFVIADGLALWAWKTGYNMLGMNLGFAQKIDKKMKTIVPLADFSNIDTKAGDIFMTWTGATTAAVIMGGVLLVAVVGYVILPKLCYEMLRGGSVGNPMGFASGATAAAGGAGVKALAGRMLGGKAAGAGAGVGGAAAGAASNAIQNRSALNRMGGALATKLGGQAARKAATMPLGAAMRNAARDARRLALVKMEQWGRK
ncbi:MAG: hypothetical protein PHS41_10900 [Victivallaceae bacterium]|nr:hypothetical protein [Victivallaceae bacterium]